MAVGKYLEARRTLPAGEMPQVLPLSTQTRDVVVVSIQIVNYTRTGHPKYFVQI